MASNQAAEDIAPYVFPRIDRGYQPGGHCQFSLAWAALHGEHDGECRASRLSDGSRTRLSPDSFVGLGLLNEPDEIVNHSGPTDSWVGRNRGG